MSEPYWIPLGAAPAAPPPRIVAGRVSATGAVLGGTGFTVVRTGAGLYRVTFTTPFSVTPAIVVTPHVAGANAFCRADAATASQFDARMINDAGPAVLDCDFAFVAVELV